MVYSGKVNIQQAIDDSPFSRFHWVIIVLGFLVLAIDGFDTAAMGYIAPTLFSRLGDQETRSRASIKRRTAGALIWRPAGRANFRSYGT